MHHQQLHQKLQLNEITYDGAAMFGFYDSSKTKQSAKCGSGNCTCNYKNNTGTSSYISASCSGNWIKIYYSLEEVNLSNYDTLSMTVSKCSNSWEMTNTYSFAVGKITELDTYKKELTYKSSGQNGTSTCKQEVFTIDINDLKGTDNYLAIKVDHGTDVSAYTTSLTINQVKFYNE